MDIKTVTKNNKTVLLVDELIAQELNINDYVSLFPAPNKKSKWGINIDEYSVISNYINKFSNETVAFFHQNDFINNDSEIECYSKLVRPCISQILHIIIFRLIRIYRLLNIVAPKDLLLLNSRKFDAPISLNNLSSLARDSWEFNQFVINHIISDVESIDFKAKDVLYPIDFWDFSKWSYYEGFGNHIPNSLNNRIKRILGNPQLALRVREKSKNVKKKISSYGKEIPVLIMGYNESFFLKKGFFWPLGYFCKLPQVLPNIQKSILINDGLRKNYSDKTKDFFFNGILMLLKELGIETKNEEYLNNISTLFFKLYPSNLLEGSEFHCGWSIETLRKFKIKHFFTYDTGGSDIAIYYNYAATKLGFKIWSQQHSAWGGYIANVPNIAEISIAGSDYYITSGWSHSESILPTWKKNAIPISSPHYSELSKNKISKNINNTVLILTGEVFNYPILSAGSHNVDDLWFWVENITNIIRGLADKNINIILKTYAPRVDRLLRQYGVIEEWEYAGGDKIKVLDFVKKGSAQEIFHLASATIWDMPGGGFVESIIKGVPAFSFWNNNFIRCQPEANNDIENLVNAGILNETSEKMVNNVFDSINDNNWYNENCRTQAINNFLEKYIKTDNNWTFEWKQLLNNIIENK